MPEDAKCNKLDYNTVMWVDVQSVLRDHDRAVVVLVMLTDISLASFVSLTAEGVKQQTFLNHV